FFVTDGHGDVFRRREDGQISKLEQQETHELRLLNKAKLKDKDLTLEDLEKCQLSRNKLVKYAVRSWVRYLIGANQGQPVYRICEITNLGTNPAKPYNIENEYFDTNLELRHGTAIKVYPMDKVFNAAFTEADIATILVRKAELNHSLPKTHATATKAALERGELVRMRGLAQMHHDFAESAALDTQQGADRKGGHPREGERAQSTGECNTMRRAEVAEAEHRKKTHLARAVPANSSWPGMPGVFKCILLLFFAVPARLTLPHRISPLGLAERTPMLGASPALGDGARSMSPAPAEKSRANTLYNEYAKAAAPDAALRCFPPVDAKDVTDPASWYAQVLSLSGGAFGSGQVSMLDSLGS
ncbi:hypothetical protein DFH11DRAFT_1728519, partial [Phellopilus nigrolimitatus]